MWLSLVAFVMDQFCVEGWELGLHLLQQSVVVGGLPTTLVKERGWPEIDDKGLLNWPSQTPPSLHCPGRSFGDVRWISRDGVETHTPLPQLWWRHLPMRGTVLPDPAYILIVNFSHLLSRVHVVVLILPFEKCWKKIMFFRRLNVQ